MKDLRKQIITEARSWIGTPHKHNQALKGVGVDCVRFPYEVAKSCGIEVSDPGNYERNPQGEELLNRLTEQLCLVGVVREAYKNWSDKYLEYTATNKQLVNLAEPGDILVFKREWMGEAGHLALFLDNNLIIQSFMKTGVRETSLGTAKLLCAIFRFRELA